MEEKIVRGAALVMTMLAVFICSSLYYLPALETSARQYVARQMQQRKQRQQRQEMWATLSGLEFLDYATKQAMATAEDTDETSEGQLGFSQQLRLELPAGVTQENVKIENFYAQRKIDIEIPDAGQDYLIRYPMLGSSDHIEDLDYYSDAQYGVLELSMEHVYELSLDWEDQYLYIDFISPRDLYDRIVVIDAGHGAGMPGATVDGVQEKDIDLEIVKELKKVFDSAGDETLGVYYTRLDDSNPEFADRSGLANDLEADLFVSVHNNSYPADPSIHGTAVLYDEKKETDGNSSKHLAQILLEQMTGELSSKNMGLVKGNDIYIIRTSEPPVALVEVGFMTNPGELADLQDKGYQKKCARAIYQSIMQALKEGY